MPWKIKFALKNKVCPEIFHCFEIFLSFRIFEVLTLALKTKVVMKCFAVFNILLTFRMFEQLLLALKNRVCLEFTVLNVFFILQNFEQLALALKNRVCPENFHSIEYSFYIQDFWATCACPEKQSVPWIHRIEYIFFIIQNFEQTCACPEKQNPPWNFSLYWNIFYLSGFSSNLILPWKQSLPWIFQAGGATSPPPRTPLSAASFCSCKLRWCSDECVLVACFNAQPDIFAVMNCCVVAVGWFSSDILTCSADNLYSVQRHILQAQVCDGISTKKRNGKLVMHHKIK